MTQDLNQTPEPKKPALCEPCAGIQQNWRRAPGHAELVQGVNRKAERSHGQVTITKYRCERCGTAWGGEQQGQPAHGLVGGGSIDGAKFTWVSEGPGGLRGAASGGARVGHSGRGNGLYLLLI